MTLDCKSRHFHSSSNAESQSKIPDIHSIRLATEPIFREGKEAPSHSVITITNQCKTDQGMKYRGDNFLHRLLEIERRHDERRGIKKSIAGAGAAGTGTPRSDLEVVSTHGTNQDTLRSPTRWLSEQIFDDTDEGLDEAEESTNDRISFSKTAYSRLPSLSEVCRVPSRAGHLTKSLSLDQKASDYPQESFSNISYVDFQQASDDFQQHNRSLVKKRPLRLPPIFLPPIYKLRPRPLKERNFLTPTHIRGPITDDEWEELRQCRYLRPAPARFSLPRLSSSQISLL